MCILENYYSRILTSGAFILIICAVNMVYSQDSMLVFRAQNSSESLEGRSVIPYPQASSPDQEEVPEEKVVSHNAPITVTASQWAALQAQVLSLQNQMAKESEKAEKKREEEEKKKKSSPNTKFGARFFLDAAGSDQNQDSEEARGRLKNGTEFRQIRLNAKGTMYDTIEYAFEMDFGGSNYKFTDVYAGLYNLFPCQAGIRGGHFKEPWSMEELGSDPETVFMERSSMNYMKSLVGGRNLGVMIHNWHNAEHFTWAAGMFVSSMKDTPSLAATGEKGHLAFTTRMTYLPFYCEASCGALKLWHVGAAYTYRNYDAARASEFGTSVNVKPEANIPGTISSTVFTTLDSLNALSLETALVNGPWCVSAEQAFYWMNDTNSAFIDDSAFIQAGYVQVSYMLTGESRLYKKNSGVLGGIKPNCPFIRSCKDGVGVFTGPGAWELAYRCAWIDLSDYASVSPDSTAGKTMTHSFGVNWYLNQNCRMMFDYVLADTDYKSVNKNGLDGRANIYQMRFQVMF